MAGAIFPVNLLPGKPMITTSTGATNMGAPSLIPPPTAVAARANSIAGDELTPGNA